MKYSARITRLLPRNAIAREFLVATFHIHVVNSLAICASLSNKSFVPFSSIVAYLFVYLCLASCVGKTTRCKPQKIKNYKIEKGKNRKTKSTISGIVAYFADEAFGVSYKLPWNYLKLSFILVTVESIAVSP